MKGEKMMTYSHLNDKERHQMELLLEQGYSQRQTAKQLGRSPSTINREYKRGRQFKGHYLSDMTIRELNEKKQNLKRKRIADNPVISDYIEQNLKNKYSPAIISSQILKDIGYYIGKDAIYDWIYERESDLTKYLTRKHKKKMPKNVFKRRKKDLIKNRVDIDLRPEEANLRLEFGHFEGDTILSCEGSKSGLLVIADRKTRKIKIRKLTRKTSSQVSSQIVLALSDYNVLHLHTITYDNGSEFFWHEKINKKLQMKSYFCKPYHSWEKGLVEHVNELIRRWFPKKTDFDTITRKQIQEVEDWVNNRPMKVLEFKSPNQVYAELEGVAL
jgi:transposase, IS30 family